MDPVLLDPAALSAGARYRLLISVLVPRPIAWVTTQPGAGGPVNLAPFSFYAGISASPPLVGLGIGRRDGEPKDTTRNLLRTGEAVIHLVELPDLEAVVASSAELSPEESEVEALGLETAPSLRVGVPGLARARVRLEARLHRHLEFGDGPVDFLVLEILAFRLAPELVNEAGHVREELLQPVGRLGGSGYAPVERRIQVERPRSEA